MTATPVTCLACRHWSLRDAPAMARHGFGVCAQDKSPGKTSSGTFERVCIRFAPLPQAEVQKREEWIKKRSNK